MKSKTLPIKTTVSNCDSCFSGLEHSWADEILRFLKMFLLVFETARDPFLMQHKHSNKSNILSGGDLDYLFYLLMNTFQIVFIGLDFVPHSLISVSEV